VSISVMSPAPHLVRCVGGEVPAHEVLGGCPPSGPSQAAAPADLTARLGELDAESENLRITRKTLLDIPAPAPTDEPARPDVPDHPAYQQILTTFADTGKPLRARDLCQALDLLIVPKNTEGIRSKLKRLVTRGILTEPEPGLFAQPCP
jgi:hypothetical protein